MGKKKNNNRQGAATGSPAPADESGTPDAATPTPASPVTADAAPPAASPAPEAPEAATVNDEQPASPPAVEQQHDEQAAQAPESAQASELTRVVADSSKTESEAPAAVAVTPVAEASADAGAQGKSEPPISSVEGRAETADAQEAVAEVPMDAPVETPASAPEDDAAPSSAPAVEEAAPAAVEPQPAAEEAADVAPKEGNTPATEPEAAAAAPAESDSAAPTEEPQPAEPEATAPAQAEAAAPPAAGDDAVTPKRKAQRSGSKKPRSASKTPANKRSSSKPAGTAGGASTAKKRSPSATKKTPRSASKGASTAVKKAIAVAAAHIPKRALSFGRNRSTADAPVAVEASPIAAASPTSDAADASPSHETNPAASPSPMRRESSALFSGSMNMSASFSRKTALRLYGETAEHATDPKTRATALRNVGWIYATGTTDAPVNLEKAYAYFYHAAKDGDEAARFYMAQLQLKRNLAPELGEWNPNSVGTDEAMSARRAGRGRSASPRRGSKSPARAKSPGVSTKRANANPTGPFGGLKKAIENLELCAAAGNAEAMLELAFLYDPTMPAPAGYVAPAAAAAPADTAAPAAAASKTPRPSVTAATALTPSKGGAAADAAAPVAPVLVRAMDVARGWYSKAAEAGIVTASMRLEDLDANEARAVTVTGRTFTRYSGPAAA